MVGRFNEAMSLRVKHANTIWPVVHYEHWLLLWDGSMDAVLQKGKLRGQEPHDKKCYEGWDEERKF